MGFRILIALVGAACVVLVYGIYDLSRMQRRMDDAPANFVIGPADADITISGFFDYACSPCRAADAALQVALEKDGRVRYIPRALAGDTPESARKAKLAYGAGMLGRFKEAHSLLLNDFRALDSTREQALAEKLDVPMAEWETSTNAPPVGRIIKKNQDLLDFTGAAGSSLSAPVFVISPNLVFRPETGVPLVEQFTRLFQDARRMNGAP